ncbi:hypothetical protein F4825DRAFT_444967 [Nemania diffusa]|nr:hypothetical protein F4825DRAFT_444967 [Nemania diffusa]
MDAYSATMNQPPQPPQPPQAPRQQSPRGVTLEDNPVPSHRRNNSHFGSHDDFYAFLDNNRGPSMASTSGPSASDRSPPPAPMPPQQQQPLLLQQQLQQQQQQQQQRTAPTQSRPPVTNLFPDRSRPPSYSGSRSEEQLLTDKNTGAKVARQNQRRGVPLTATTATKPPSSSSSGPRQRTTSPTPPVSGGSSPTHPHRPVSGAGSIQRLKSPSVLECVLQPLDQKVREYDLHMRREQEEIKRLDDELRVLQARRAEAEARFDEARGKHDEYRRQYTDVERAMSGELPMSPRSQQQQHPQLQRPATMQGAMTQQGQRAMSMRRFPDDVDGEEFDDDEDFAVPPFGQGRRINSQQSFGRASQKTGGKERFRFSSLFGGGR